MKRSEFIKSLIALPAIGVIAEKLSKPSISNDWIKIEGLDVDRWYKKGIDSKTGKPIHWVKQDMGAWGMVTWAYWPELDGHLTTYIPQSYLS